MYTQCQHVLPFNSMQNFVFSVLVDAGFDIGVAAVQIVAFIVGCVAAGVGKYWTVDRNYIIVIDTNSIIIFMHCILKWKPSCLTLSHYSETSSLNLQATKAML